MKGQRLGLWGSLGPGENIRRGREWSGSNSCSESVASRKSVIHVTTSETAQEFETTPEKEEIREFFDADARKKSMRERQTIATNPNE